MPENHKKTVAFLQGNETCSVAALHAGVRFFAGYPITPSSEIAAVMALKLPLYGGMFVQMEDEIASMAAIIGAAMTGAKTMTATSGPGFSLKQENIGYAALCEVPCIIINVQRGGPSTGLPTELAQADIMQTRWGTHGDHSIIAFAPSSIEEIYRYTIKAVNIAEAYRTPVVILLDEVLAHMRERLEIPPIEKIQAASVERKRPTVKPEDFKPFDTSFGNVPPMADFGSGYRYHTTGLIHDESGFPTASAKEIVSLLERLKNKIKPDDPNFTFWRELETEDANTMVISFGSASRVARRAVNILRQQGRRIGLLQLITLWPAPEKLISKLCKRVKKVFVVEMNQGQYIREIERIAGNDAKIKLITRIDGKLITPEQVIDALQGGAR